MCSDLTLFKCVSSTLKKLKQCSYARLYQSKLVSCRLVFLPRSKHYPWTIYSAILSPSNMPWGFREIWIDDHNLHFLKIVTFVRQADEEFAGRSKLFFSRQAWFANVTGNSSRKTNSNTSYLLSVGIVYWQTSCSSSWAWKQSQVLSVKAGALCYIRRSLRKRELST